MDPQQTIQNVFRAVQHGEAAHGVVPFENSTNGSVIFTLDHLADKHNWYPDVHVEAEIYLAVEHVLAGFIAKSTSSEEDQKTDKTSRMSQPWRRVDSKDTNDTVANSDKADKGRGKASEDNEDAPPTPRANKLQANLTTSPATAPEPEAIAAVEPLHDISHIKTVHSHPQAWGQCVRFWNTYLKGADQHDSTATSRAALEVAKGADPSHAAICSRLAAKGYGLDILADGIQDDRGNCTRFLVLRSNKSKIPPISSPPANSLEVIELVGPPLPPPLPPANSFQATYKSLLTFTVSHQTPGALAECLSVFATHGLNLTNFTSRPSGNAPWHYTFFVEFRGRARPGGKGAVNDALREVANKAETVKFLGSWEDRMYRKGEEGAYKKI